MDQLRYFIVTKDQLATMNELSVGRTLEITDHPKPAKYIDALSNRRVLQMSEEDQEVIHHQLLDLFATVGVKDDGEPNSIGLKIEDLINVFNIYTYE